VNVSADANSSVQAGTVYLAGAGPGDPGLVTLRVAELLRVCDCIVYDALVAPEIMALSNPAAERIYVGKRGNQHAVEQPDINQILVDQARAGKKVLRLKGGDPYLFGRGAEEALCLVEQGIPVEVIPGVTAGIAAPAYAGIPVTHRDHASAVAFVTGHEDPSKPESALDWGALSKVGTLCFYMGIKNLGRIAGQLSQHLPTTTPVAVIQWGTTRRQRSVVGTLATIEGVVREAGIQAPALTIVGEVVSLRNQLNFFERAPLFGKRIVVTRARAQASELADGLRNLGAQIYEFPTIRIAPTELPGLADAVKELAAGRFNWVVLTSVNGVDALFDELAKQGLDARSFKAHAAAIGSATARRLLERGVKADLIPPEYVAESIVEALKQRGAIRGQRFLLARADIARSELATGLRELGGEPVDVEAYKTILETAGQDEALEALGNGDVDIVTFTSASTARNFAQIVGTTRLATLINTPTVRMISIGPITSTAMRDSGIPVHAEARVHDIPGVIEACKQLY
jgi:uroporphyrinogen III methyltransferase/synthase